MSFAISAQTNTIPERVTADVALTEAYTATPWGGGPMELGDIVVKIKTAVAGAGTLLVTVRYNDGEVDQELNVALALTAGNYAVATWPDIWRDSSVNVQVGYTFLAPGGEADVYILVRGI